MNFQSISGLLLAAGLTLFLLRLFAGKFSSGSEELDRLIQSLESSVIDETEESEIARLMKLKEWVENSGIEKAVRIQVIDKELGHRGVVADRDINAGETVLQVPRDLILCASDVATGRALTTFPKPLKSLLKRYGRSKTLSDIRHEHNVLALYILWHRFLGKRTETKSKFGVYVRSLPERVNTLPRYYDQDDRALLEGTVTLRRAEERDEEIRESYVEILSSNRYRSLASPFSLDEFLWSRDMVDTRCFRLFIRGSRETALIPFADMPNHASSCALRWKYVDEQRSFVANATCSLKEGSEVFLNYGNKDNTLLLAKYGFALEDNSMNCVEMIILKQEVESNTDGTGEMYVHDDAIAVSCFLYESVFASRECLHEMELYWSTTNGASGASNELLWLYIHDQAKAWFDFFSSNSITNFTSAKTSVNSRFAIAARKSEQKLWGIWYHRAESMLRCPQIQWWKEIYLCT